MENTEAEVVVLKSPFSGLKVTDHNHLLHLSSGDVRGAVQISIQLVVTLTPGVMFVPTYLSKLKDPWDEYDTIVGPPFCNCEKSKTETEPRSQILMIIPTLTFNQVYDMIVQDKSPKHIPSGSHGGGDILETTTIFTAQEEVVVDIDHLKDI
ncbi:hypothetical protein R3W88_024679 [Solanum pinnatisectum]|uniref:Uncharacterized protein n=1 Tax=Solanum pinnatisectum TaxID=50273 RepID=A0AAV9M1A6_9SOLN|nr:hypothetical protein R3W88_024679 [Solanum pinnatisectum]